MYQSSSLRCAGVCLLSLHAASCAGPPPAAAPRKSPPPAVAPSPSAAAPRPEPPARALRTGKLNPTVDPAVELQVVARTAVGKSEIIEALLPDGSSLAPGAALGTGTWVGLSPAENTLAFIGLATVTNAKGSVEPLVTGLHLWVRRPTSRAPLAGTFFTPAGMSASSAGVTPGHRIPFTAAMDAKVPAPQDLEQKWGVALASDFEARPGVFYRFAAARTLLRYGGKKPVRNEARNLTRREGELAELMDTATGRLSI
ncbi:MAG TPA: hypothetical protein VHU80_08205, partial [Polyangiaceae bacterium]|nr:hypothetical protein [Polyangiaceae bacterium]